MDERETLIKAEIDWLNDVKCSTCPYNNTRSCVGWRTAVLCKAADKSPNDDYRANMKDVQRKIESVQMVVAGVNCGVVTIADKSTQGIFNAALKLQTDDTVHSDVLNALAKNNITLTFEGFKDTFNTVKRIETQLKRRIS